MKKKTNLIVIIILLLLLIIEIILVRYNCFYAIDNYIYNLVSKTINDTNTIIFRGFSFLGNEIFIILVCLLVLILARKKSRGVGFVFIIGLCLLFNQSLKLIIARERPNINPLAIESSYSFPSGHTMIIITIVGLLMFYLWKYKKGSNGFKIILSIIMIIIAFFVMVSRIYLGVHYFSDIIGGITASLLLLAIIYYYYSFKYKVPYFPKKR